MFKGFCFIWGMAESRRLLLGNSNLIQLGILLPLLLHSTHTSHYSQAQARAYIHGRYWFRAMTVGPWCSSQKNKACPWQRTEHFSETVSPVNWQSVCVLSTVQLSAFLDSRLVSCSAVHALTCEKGFLYALGGITHG